MNEFIQQNLADVGVDLEVEVFEWNALTAHTRQGAAASENRGLGACNSSWNTMEPYNAFIRFADSWIIPPKGSNWGYINDPELDALCAAACETPEGPAQDAVLGKIDTKLVDQAVFLWIVQVSNSTHQGSPQWASSYSEAESKFGLSRSLARLERRRDRIR